MATSHDNTCRCFLDHKRNTQQQQNKKANLNVGNARPLAPNSQVFRFCHLANRLYQRQHALIL